jgi:hypothetical protein
MPTTVLKRVPAGLAGFVDGSDAPIVVLLHVVDRICQVIEIYHAAGDQITGLPAKWVSLGTLMKDFP